MSLAVSRVAGFEPLGIHQAMKTKCLFMSFAAALLAVSCSSTQSQQNHEEPPPKANRVQVLMYDTTPRLKAEHFDIYGPSRPKRHYKIIALLTCEGAVDQEVVMTRAIYYRARLIGADGVMEAGNTTIVGTGWSGGSSLRTIFRDYAIVYTDK